MKVALDENISHRMVGILGDLYGRRGWNFVHVSSIVPPKTADEHWAEVFRRDGGEIVLTGDKRIAERPHQLKAFKDNKLICFFFASPWGDKKIHEKVAHTVFWWPSIETQIRHSKAGDCWRIPFTFSDGPMELIELPAGAHAPKIPKTPRAKAV